MPPERRVDGDVGALARGTGAANFCSIDERLGADSLDVLRRLCPLAVVQLVGDQRFVLRLLAGGQEGERS